MTRDSDRFAIGYVRHRMCHTNLPVRGCWQLVTCSLHPLHDVPVQHLRGLFGLQALVVCSQCASQHSSISHERMRLKYPCGWPGQPGLRSWANVDTGGLDSLAVRAGRGLPRWSS